MEQPVLSGQPGKEAMDLNLGLSMDEIHANKYLLHTEVDIKPEPMDDEDSYDATGRLLDDHHIALEHQHVKREVESSDFDKTEATEETPSRQKYLHCKKCQVTVNTDVQNKNNHGSSMICVSCKTGLKYQTRDKKDAETNFCNKENLSGYNIENNNTSYCLKEVKKPAKMNDVILGEIINNDSVCKKNNHVNEKETTKKSEFIKSKIIIGSRKSEAFISEQNGIKQNYEKKIDVNSTESKNNSSSISNCRNTKTSDFIPSKIVIGSKKRKSTDLDQNINKEKYEDKVQKNNSKRLKVNIGTKQSPELRLSKKKSIKKDKKENINKEKYEDKVQKNNSKRLKVNIGTKQSPELRLSKKKSIKKDKKERKEPNEIGLLKNGSQNKDVYKCDICFKTFTFKNNLSRHTEVLHKKNTTHACNKCDKGFARKDYLDRHMLGVHNIGKKIITCICGKEYADRSNYTRHVRKYCLQYERKKTSEQDLKFSCDICQKKFFTNYYLQKHRILHDDSKLPMCDYCQSKFRCRYSLIRHIQSHMGILPKPFKCEICNKKFSRKNILDKHSITHTAGKRFQCKICNAKFKSQWGCTNHEKNLCKITSNLELGELKD